MSDVNLDPWSKSLTDFYSLEGNPFTLSSPLDAEPVCPINNLNSLVSETELAFVLNTNEKGYPAYIVDAMDEGQVAKINGVCYRKVGDSLIALDG